MYGCKQRPKGQVERSCDFGHRPFDLFVAQYIKQGPSTPQYELQRVVVGTAAALGALIAVVLGQWIGLLISNAHGRGIVNTIGTAFYNNPNL